jgi:hypothetical protein
MATPGPWNRPNFPTPHQNYPSDRSRVRLPAFAKRPWRVSPQPLDVGEGGQPDEVVRTNRQALCGV